MRVRAISARASGAFSGGSATARSATTSTAVPPWPNRITGPNSGSTWRRRSAPAPAAPHHGLHREALTRASGRSRRDTASIARRAALVGVVQSSASATRPDVALVLICGDRIFSTTG
jgi:hypothetical protein